MPGKYYFKHAVFHTVDNRDRINALNENFKNMIKQNALNYLRTTEDSLEKQAEFLKSLTHDNYRVGNKYKYDCSLNIIEISSLIRVVNNNELHKMVLGKSFEEYDQQNITFWVVIGIILVLGAFLYACST